MKASELIKCFERMLAEHWTYEYGAAREGCVDCSGAFVYAFKQYGQSIAHGSNTIARQYVSGGLTLACNAKPGYAVFKRRDANDSMPAQYRNDGLGDIYHIGLLDADGVSVLNAKNEATGFSSDPLSKWDYAAPLKGVEYEEDADMVVLYQAIVATQSDPLRVRDAPVTGRILGRVDRGKTVDVLKDGDWPRIMYNELVGYVSGEYLQKIVSTDSVHTAPGIDDSSGTCVIPYALAKQLYAALGYVLSVD